MAESERQAFWRRLLAEVDRGATVREVAARRNVNARTLAWWCSRLRRERREETVSLLPVVVRGGAVTHPSPIEIQVSGVTVRVEHGVDVGYVVALVHALRAC